MLVRGNITVFVRLVSKAGESRVLKQAIACGALATLFDMNDSEALPKRVCNQYEITNSTIVFYNKVEQQFSLASRNLKLLQSKVGPIRDVNNQLKEVKFAKEKLRKPNHDDDFELLTKDKKIQ